MNQPIPSKSRYYCVKAFQGPSYWTNQFTVIPLLAGLCSLALATLHGQCPQGCNDNSNTYFGLDAFAGNGLNNSAFGAAASAGTGSFNTATGYRTINGSSFVWNATTATGAEALRTHQVGDNNTATGYQALYGTIDSYGDGHRGSWNTATGVQALFEDKEADYNTATGYAALHGRDSALSANYGSRNTVIGTYALYDNNYGSGNTAIGTAALISNSDGSNNTSTGSVSSISSGRDNNTANGESALRYVNGDGGSTAVGFSAGNSAAGFGGSRFIALGESAGINLTTGTDNIAIGHKGVAGESKTIRIGKRGTQTKTVIAGINGTTVSGGIGVLVDANGRLGTTTSSARFKEAIEPMDKASEAIRALKPVTFRYKKELDPEGIPQFGLIAEEVEKINPALVAHDDQSKPYTVRYDAVNAMLLNEFIKDVRAGEDQEAAIVEIKSTVARHDKALAQQQQEIAGLTAHLKEQAEQIQEVTDRLAASQPAPRVVLNER